MNRKILGLALAILLALCSFVNAQQPVDISKIGYLGGSRAGSIRLQAFRQGLRDLGYIEGWNIAIEYRYTEGKLELIPALAAEWVRLKVDVIVVGGGVSAVLPAKQATNSIPIIFTNVGDAVASGVVPRSRAPEEMLRDLQPLLRI